MGLNTHISYKNMFNLCFTSIENLTLGFGFFGMDNRHGGIKRDIFELHQNNLQ